MMTRCKLRSIRYKLLGCFVEKLADSIVTSINHTHKKEIEAISKKISEAESDVSKTNSPRNAFKEKIIN